VTLSWRACPLSLFLRKKSADFLKRAQADGATGYLLRRGAVMATNFLSNCALKGCEKWLKDGSSGWEVPNTHGKHFVRSARSHVFQIRESFHSFSNEARPCEQPAVVSIPMSRTSLTRPYPASFNGSAHVDVSALAGYIFDASQSSWARRWHVVAFFPSC